MGKNTCIDFNNIVKNDQILTTCWPVWGPMKREFC